MKALEVAKCIRGGKYIRGGKKIIKVEKKIIKVAKNIIVEKIYI